MTITIIPPFGAQHPHWPYFLLDNLALIPFVPTHASLYNDIVYFEPYAHTALLLSFITEGLIQLEGSLFTYES